MTKLAMSCAGKSKAQLTIFFHKFRLVMTPTDAQMIDGLFAVG